MTALRGLGFLILVLILTTPAPLDADQGEAFSTPELERLLAPIALYPDTLLAQMLVAATHPLAVVEAARFSRANPGLQGAEAIAAAEDRGWDSSVLALVAFPEVIQRMSDELRWTQDLGEAFILQEEEVMAAVQSLRDRARAAGTLSQPEHLRLERERDQLSMAPSREDVVHVPWYDTTRAYGHWPHPGHRPVYWDPIPWHHSGRHGSSAFLWGPGIHLDPLFFPHRLDWPGRSIVLIHSSPLADNRVTPRRGIDHRDRRTGRRNFRSPHRFDDRASFRERGDRRTDAGTGGVAAGGAIDTRTAAERLRQIQAEQAAQQRRDERRPTTRRMGGGAPEASDTSSRTSRATRQHSRAGASSRTEALRPSPSARGSEGSSPRRMGGPSPERSSSARMGTSSPRAARSSSGQRASAPNRLAPAEPTRGRQLGGGMQRQQPH